MMNDDDDYDDGDGEDGDDDSGDGDDQHAGEETNKLKRFAYILKFCHQIILDGITPKHNPNLTQVTRSEKRRHFE